MGDLGLWKVFVSLGVPGLALGVFYMLVRRFEWKFPAVPRKWVAPIIALFLVLTFGLVFTALVLWAPGRGPAEQPQQGTPVGDADAAPSTGVDRADARATAKGILSAYKSKDMQALAGFMLLDNRQIVEELKIQGANHPRFASLFEGWRWLMVEPWDGTIDEVRYWKSPSGRLTAQVKFDAVSADEVAVVTLYRADGRWYFEDIHSPTLESFQSGSNMVLE